MNQKLFSKDFTLVVIGQIISLFGNATIRFALPLYLLNLTGSSALYGTVTACAFIPAILLSPIGGIVADRVNKRNIMVILDFFTVAVILAFSLLMNGVNLILLLTVTLMFLYGIAGKFNHPQGLLGGRAILSLNFSGGKEMAYGAKTYTLREESTESGTRYLISFKDGQGKQHELEVSEQLFLEFRQMERKNRNLQQWNQRHREFNEVWDETLYRRALRVPKTLDERMIEKERNELFYKAVARLPEIQRRRFLL